MPHHDNDRFSKMVVHPQIVSINNDGMMIHHHHSKYFFLFFQISNNGWDQHCQEISQGEKDLSGWNARKKSFEETTTNKKQ